MLCIFKTDIPRNSGNAIIEKIKVAFPVAAAVTIDLEDYDKVLRVVGVTDEQAIINLVESAGYTCETLN